MKNGRAVCQHGSVPAAKIEAFVVEQIHRIGSDPALCDETFRQVQAQVATEQRRLKAEAKRLDRELVTARGEIDRLSAAIARATSAAADALMTKLTEIHGRVTTLEIRRQGVADQLVALAAQDVDPEAVRRALAQFTDIWAVLVTPERERVVRLLIERIDHHGADGKLTFSFSTTGANLLAAEVGS